MRHLHPSAPAASALARALWHALVLVMLLAASPFASAATYAFKSATYTWESAANTISWDRSCTGYPGDDDQATINFSGGFTFSFAGVSYSSVRVLANGALQFGTDTGFFRQYTNANLPYGVGTITRPGCTNTSTARVILVYWTDLDPSRAGSGGVTWEQKGTAPNRYVVVSWNGVYQYNTSTPYTFQVLLYENGTFKYQFGNANATGANATIGVQVDTGDYTLYGYNSGYNANGTAILWTVGSGAASRLAEFRFDEYGYTGLVGEVIDSSGNDHHAVRVGGVDTNPTAVVCRSVYIPANTSAAQSAIDTLLDVDGVIGTIGSVSMWYRSDAAWNGGAAALLFDATTVANRPFFLMRASNGRLQFSAADSGGTILTATTSTINTPANTWVHVAATWRFLPGVNQTTIRVYVDGALAATTSGTTTGVLDSSLASLFLGDNRSSVTPSGGTRNSTAGYLDEARIYNYEINVAEIAADRAATHSCLPPVDHYELSAPTSSLTCTGATLTVTACRTAITPCVDPVTSLSGQSVTLSSSAGSLAAATVALDAAGSGTASLQYPTGANGSVVTVTLGGLPVPAAGGTYCCPNGTSCAASDHCDTTFSTAGFIVAGAIDGPPVTVPAQSAGTLATGFVLRAVKTGGTTGACEAALSGPQTVAWSYECNNPATCAAGNLMSISSTPVAGNPNGAVSSSTPVAMVFDAGGNAPFDFNFQDVGRVTLYASKAAGGSLPTALSGQTNAFVVKPYGFTLSNIRCTTYAPGSCATTAIASPGLNPGATTAADTAFMPAGSAFSATVTATMAGGAAAPSYGRESPPAGVTLTANLLQPAGGNAPPLNNPSSFGAFASGVASGTAFAWPEVGIVSLTPRVAGGSYLGAGDVVGTTSGAVGRFTAARFVLSGTTVTQRAALACAPASAFTYLGENFQLGFTLTAQNSAGTTTQNYGGAFAKLDPASATAWNLAGRDGSTLFSTGSGRLSLGSASGSWSAGMASGITLTAAALRAATPDGPFSVAFGIAPVDSDGVVLSGYDVDTDLTPGNDHGAIGFVPLRFGRLYLASAIGAADRPLALPATAQYWNGSAFDTNTLDSCTAVAAGAVSFGNLRRTLTTADTAVASPITLSAGRGSLRLAVPGGGRSGSVDVALSLGSAALDASCLQPWAPGAGDAATVGANLPFLRGGWCSASFDKDPSARATFGQQRGNDFLVYRRENY